VYLETSSTLDTDDGLGGEGKGSEILKGINIERNKCLLHYLS
jgi:hypothetical protein